MFSLKLNLKRGFRESLGEKNSINEREEKEEGGGAIRYCYAAEMGNWTDCL
jgi:hypothetical protein